jgi:DNA-binding HxlR family transcriptional regulator
MDRRSYNQYCGLARALDVVGERWTLLVVRNLLLGPLRYSDLLRGLPGITTNLLAKRLKEMEELGLIERIRVGTTDSSQAYRLTRLGSELEPAVAALSRWAWQTMAAPKKKELRSFEYLLIPLRQRYRGGVSLRAELVADGAPYRVVLTESNVEIARGETPTPDVRLRGSGAAIARALMQPPSRRLTLPGVEVDGSPDALRKLLSAFDTHELSAVANAALRFA